MDRECSGAYMRKATQEVCETSLQFCLTWVLAIEVILQMPISQVIPGALVPSQQCGGAHLLRH